MSLRNPLQQRGASPFSAVLWIVPVLLPGEGVHFREMDAKSFAVKRIRIEFGTCNRMAPVPLLIGIGGRDAGRIGFPSSRSSPRIAEFKWKN
jgi:hypothetical protein